MQHVVSRAVAECLETAARRAQAAISGRQKHTSSPICAKRLAAGDPKCSTRRHFAAEVGRQATGRLDEARKDAKSARGITNLSRVRRRQGSHLNKDVNNVSPDPLAGVHTARLESKTYLSNELDPTRHGSRGVVSTLKHGLEEVVENPSRVFPQEGGSFDPRLRDLPQPHEVHLDMISKFIPPSGDAVSAKLALEAGCRFLGSSSSLTSALEIIARSFMGRYHRLHFAMSPSLRTGPDLAFLRPVLLHVKPAFGILTINNPTTEKAIDAEEYAADLGSKSEELPEVLLERQKYGILALQGHIGEALLTQDFATMQHWKRDSDARPEQPWQDTSLAYAYKSTGGLFMRSQLDARTEGPAGKLFDVKCRAALPARMDPLERTVARSYRIDRQEGELHSFERELADITRNVLFRWTLQARIGSMDGFFVAFHNTKHIFGYRFMPLAEAESCVATSSAHAQAAFNIATRALADLLEHLDAFFKGREFQFGFAPVYRKNEAMSLQIIACSMDKHAPRTVALNFDVRSSDFDAVSGNWQVEADISRLDGTTAGRLWNRLMGLRTASMRKWWSLPADVIAKLTESDLETLAAHNAAGEKTTPTMLHGLLLLPGQSYRPAATERVARLRRTLSSSS